MSTRGVMVYVDDGCDRQIQAAATRGLVPRPLSASPSTWHLAIVDGQLALRDAGSSTFSLDERRIYRRIVEGRRGLLAQACGVQPGLRVLDVFGGWGIDGMTLAARGCVVRICELSPLVHAMSQDLCTRLGSEATCVCEDGIKTAERSATKFDVAYLDTMFPSHPSGALPSRAMQVLEEVACETDLPDAFARIRHVWGNRIVVKLRRRQRTTLPEPTWSISGSSVRFDVYANP